MWFVQIAYYPNLACIGGPDFVRYQREHVRRVTAVAWTMLLLELLTALALPAFAAPAAVRTALGLNLILLLVIWRSTWFVQVPLHKILEQGFQADTHRRLVSTNWLRTICYSLRGALLIALMVYVFVSRAAMTQIAAG
ncbi:MAG: hypothetical protein KY475_27720 [Planctomycetes bacterium]|nr:hypothetical protein [Planctomycetota bacterium]